MLFLCILRNTTVYIAIGVSCAASTFLLMCLYCCGQSVMLMKYVGTWWNCSFFKRYSALTLLWSLFLLRWGTVLPATGTSSLVSSRSFLVSQWLNKYVDLHSIELRASSHCVGSVYLWFSYSMLINDFVSDNLFPHKIYAKFDKGNWYVHCTWSFHLFFFLLVLKREREWKCFFWSAREREC